jgi:hypothetical protein
MVTRWSLVEGENLYVMGDQCDWVFYGHAVINGTTLHMTKGSDMLTAGSHIRVVVWRRLLYVDGRHEVCMYPAQNGAAGQPPAGVPGGASDARAPPAGRVFRPLQRPGRRQARRAMYAPQLPHARIMPATRTGTQALLFGDAIVVHCDVDEGNRTGMRADVCL